ncbi:uncharacterized protein LOC116338327 [Contarinia nasturtii]|uniref:uncharacterized protein LOC116338327 n=1 Tax=Contarinia nasturtii TaxID=265458 RepID=UPI0012D378D9|nr:uncharacterized protein LOC116338327 [Contarinia nasturtii]
MMDATWTLLWLLVCLTILVLIVESIYRRMKERKLAQQENDIQRQIRDQQLDRQYHIYTLQPLANPMHTNPVTSVLSQQQQQYIRQQQELKAFNDLPPKYEDVVKDPNSYRIPIGFVNSSSDMQTACDNNTNSVRY